MTIEEIKEWRDAVETHGIGFAGEFIVEIIDTLLEEVATLEKHNAISDQDVVTLDQQLTIATEALERIAKPCHYGSADQICNVMQDTARTALGMIK